MGMAGIEYKINEYICKERVLLDREVHEMEERTDKYVTTDTNLRSIKNRIKMFYDDNADDHEAFVLDHISSGLLKMLSYHIERENVQNVTDAGCGAGIDICCLSMLFSERQFTGYDISPRMIYLAQRRKERLGLKNLTLLVADHDTLALRDIEMLYQIDSIGEEHHFITKEDKNTHQKLEDLRIKRLKHFREMLSDHGIYVERIIFPSLVDYGGYGIGGFLEDCVQETRGELYEKAGFEISHCWEIGDDVCTTQVLAFLKKH